MDNQVHVEKMTLNQMRVSIAHVRCGCRDNKQDPYLVQAANDEDSDAGLDEVQPDDHLIVTGEAALASTQLVQNFSHAHHDISSQCTASCATWLHLISADRWAKFHLHQLVNKCR